jgi:hypothetical protein
LAGIGLRAIGRTLNISNVTVLNWVRGIKEPMSTILPSEHYRLEILEMDELIPTIQTKHKLANASLIIILPQKESPKSSLVLVKSCRGKQRT